MVRNAQTEHSLQPDKSDDDHTESEKLEADESTRCGLLGEQPEGDSVAIVAECRLPEPRCHEDAKSAEPRANAYARELWDGRTVDERAAFVAEWFAEARIAADGGVESVARETYFAIVAAAWAQEVRTVGSTGLEPVTFAMSRQRSNQLS